MSCQMNEPFIQSVINLTAPKDIDSDEDDKNIYWNKKADALNDEFIKFSEHSSLFNFAKILHII